MKNENVPAAELSETATMPTAEEDCRRGDGRAEQKGRESQTYRPEAPSACTPLD